MDRDHVDVVLRFPLMTNIDMLYDATDLLLRRRRLLPDVPCVLWQVGAVETVLHSTAPSTPARFRRLQNHLAEFYPQDHELTSVFTSTYPLAPSLVESFPLRELAVRGPMIPNGASLYIPPAELRPVVDDELHSAAASPVHLRGITIRPSGDDYRQPRDPLTDESGLHPASQYVVHEDFLSFERPAEVETSSSAMRGAAWQLAIDLKIAEEGRPRV